MRDMGRIKNKNNGFTLVELMVVIAVLVIMAAAAVPGVTNWLPNYRLKKAAMDLHSNFQKAKMTAIKKKCNCTINFNQPIGAETFDYVVFTDIDNDSEYSGDLRGDGVDNDNDGTVDDADEIETVISQVRLHRDLQFDTTQGGGDGLLFTPNDSIPANPSISFIPNGLSIDNAGVLSGGTVFLINTNGSTRRIVVSNSGNVRIQN